MGVRSRSTKEVKYMQPEAYCTVGTMAGVLHDCRFGGGLAASGQGAGFGGNLFTRDTCYVLRDLMNLPSYHPFIREMLATLPQWQGVKEDPATNEFPDALTHQVFRQIVGGRYLPMDQVETARKWTTIWGVEMECRPESGWQFTLYNSSDAPLLYLTTLAEFCRKGGRGVLKDTFLHWPTGTVRTVGDAALRCVNYIVDMIARSEDAGNGLYAVPSTNPEQTSPSTVLRDGFDSYRRPSGEAIDYSLVAYIENQARAYEALFNAAYYLFPTHPKADSWAALAKELRRRTLERMWLDDQGFFAAALDRNGLVETKSSAAFETLSGPFLEGLDETPEYVTLLMRHLYSENFMTPVGVRMVSLEHQDLEGDYYAYQGSGTVWFVTNGIVASTACQWGLCGVADDIGLGRLVGGFNRAKDALELMCVHRETNEPLYRPEDARLDRGAKGSRLIYPANLGSRDQAWSASSALRQLTADHAPHRVAKGTWHRNLDEEMCERAKEFPTADVVPPSGDLVVDLHRGAQLRDERLVQAGLSLQ